MTDAPLVPRTGGLGPLAGRREAERLQAIVDVQNEIATATNLDLDEVMRSVRERARALTAAHGAVVELADGDEMVYRAGSGDAAPPVGPRLQAAGILFGLRVASGELPRRDGSEIDLRVDSEACRRVGIGDRPQTRADAWR